jgi:hypothetical protein
MGHLWSISGTTLGHPVVYHGFSSCLNLRNADTKTIVLKKLPNPFALDEGIGAQCLIHLTVNNFTAQVVFLFV